MLKKILLIILVLITFNLFFKQTSIPLISEAHAAYTLKNLGDVLVPQGVPVTFWQQGDYSAHGISMIIIILVRYFLKLAGGVAVFFIVFSGFNYVTSLGEQEKLEAAKKGLTWAILGLLIVILSYAIVENIVTLIIAVPTESTN